MPLALALEQESRMEVISGHIGEEVGRPGGWEAGLLGTHWPPTPWSLFSLLLKGLSDSIHPQRDVGWKGSDDGTCLLRVACIYSQAWCTTVPAVRRETLA